MIVTFPFTMKHAIPPTDNFENHFTIFFNEASDALYKLKETEAKDSSSLIILFEKIKLLYTRIQSIYNSYSHVTTQSNIADFERLVVRLGSILDLQVLHSFEKSELAQKNIKIITKMIEFSNATSQKQSNDTVFGFYANNVNKEKILSFFQALKGYIKRYTY